jgi:CubicO group peptidase (beta-lactamase class C family)
MARAYSMLATGGQELGLRPETLEALEAPPGVPPAGLRDTVLHVDTCFSLGYMRPYEGFRFGSSERAFGAPGAGGSLAFADPDARVGFAYAPNKMGANLLGDPRQMALSDALYRCLER